MTDRDAAAVEPRATPAMIAAAWEAFRAGRPGRLLSPGPGFVEAINAALAVSPLVAEIADLRARLAAAWEALHPFGASPVLEVLFAGVPDDFLVTVNLRASDYRRARTALPAAPAAEQDGEAER